MTYVCAFLELYYGITLNCVLGFSFTLSILSGKAFFITVQNSNFDTNTHKFNASSSHNYRASQTYMTHHQMPPQSPTINTIQCNPSQNTQQSLSNTFTLSLSFQFSSSFHSLNSHNQNEEFLLPSSSRNRCDGDNAPLRCTGSRGCMLPGGAELVPTGDIRRNTAYANLLQQAHGATTMLLQLP